MTANHPTLAARPTAPPAGLQPAGVAMLLFKGDRTLTVPNIEADRPGIRCTAHDDGAVLMEAVGWPTPVAAADAIVRAHQVCKDAGLRVMAVPLTYVTQGPARLVCRRR